MKKEEIIKALEELDVWDVNTFLDCYDSPVLDIEISPQGEWVKLEDVKKLIKQIKG